MRKERAAKEDHLNNAFEKNHVYVVLETEDQTGYAEKHPEAHGSTTTWAMAERDGKFKARFCASFFAHDKRSDLVALGASSLPSRLVDLKATEQILETFTPDVKTAYNTLDVP